MNIFIANNSSLSVNLALNSNYEPDRQARKNKTQKKQRHPRRKPHRSGPKKQTIINEAFAREENSFPGSLFVAESKPPIPPSTDTIHLRVKNKHLFPHFSLVPYPVEDHQMKIVQEFQSILQQTKQINTNALEDDPSLPRVENLTTHSMQNDNAHHRPKTSVSSTSENPSYQDERSGFIQQGVQQLQRYQQLAQQYQFKSNPAVRQFLMKSVALSSDALHKLSTNNQKK